MVLSSSNGLTVRNNTGTGTSKQEMMQNGSEVITPDDVSMKSNGYGCPTIVDKNSNEKYLNDINSSMSGNGESQQKSGYKPRPLDSKLSQSPITKCILVGNHKLLLECLLQGEDSNVICSNSGRSYLHLISQAATADRELQWLPMVYQLSNAGADVAIEDGKGTTACRLAISKKLVQIVAALLKCGAELFESDWFHAEQIRGVAKSEMLEIMRRHSPSYWSAVHDLTPHKVNRLVKAWARVNVTRNDQTLIEYAKRHAREDTIVQLLLHHEASIELAHAVMAGDRDRVRTLLCDNAVHLNTCDTSVKNNFLEPVAPLTLNGAAIKLGHLDVLNELIAAKDRRKSSSSASVDNSASGGDGGRGYGKGGRMVSENNPSVVFYKGSSSGGDEEVCQIRTGSSQPPTSALCSIL